MIKTLPTWKTALLLVSAFFVASSCVPGCKPGHEDMSPEQVVEAYLETALNMTSIDQREKLLRFTTGPLKAAIASASNDVLKAAYVDKKYKIERYSLVERRNRTPLVVEITFRLVFQDLTQLDARGKPSSDAKVTTENTVAVVKEKRVWLIRDVIGAKTAIDFFTPMTVRAGEKDTTPQESPQEMPQEAPKP